VISLALSVKYNGQHYLRVKQGHSAENTTGSLTKQINSRIRISATDSISSARNKRLTIRRPKILQLVNQSKSLRKNKKKITQADLDAAKSTLIAFPE